MIKKLLLVGLASLALLAAACHDDHTAPSQADLFAAVPDKSSAVMAVNLDSCTFVRDIVADCIIKYVSTTDAVIFTVDSEGHEPVMMLRATDPMVLSQAAYDWMQVPFDTDNGQHMLSMSTDGGITTFTDSKFVWIMRADNAKTVMTHLLTAPKGKAVASFFRLKNGKLRDAASGRITINGSEIAVAAHVHGDTLRLVSGVNVDNDTVKVAMKPSPGINARVDGPTAVKLIERLTSRLSFTHRMAINALTSFVDKAQHVDVQASPADGITVDMHYATTDGQATHIAKTLNGLVSNSGYSGLVTTVGENGVRTGPVMIDFDCNATIGIAQTTGKDIPPSFTIVITTPKPLSELLETPPFNNILH